MGMKKNTSNQLTTAITRTNRSPLRRGLVLTTLALAALALLPAAWAQSNDTEAPSQCGPGTLKGAYMSEQSGTLNALPFAQVNRIVSDGVGGITGTGTAVANGVVTSV